MFFLSAHGTLVKVDYLLGCKEFPTKFKAPISSRVCSLSLSAQGNWARKRKYSATGWIWTGRWRKVVRAAGYSESQKTHIRLQSSFWQTLIRGQCSINSTAEHLEVRVGAEVRAEVPKSKPHQLRKFMGGGRGNHYWEMLNMLSQCSHYLADRFSFHYKYLLYSMPICWMKTSQYWILLLFKLVHVEYFQ